MVAGSRTPHVAILPCPGVGHLIPLAELAKLLVLHHSFAATFITFSDGVVRREEISRVVKELMEGEGGKATRDRMAELREAAAKALTEEVSSYKALADVAGKWKAGIAV